MVNADKNHCLRYLVSVAFKEKVLKYKTHESWFERSNALGFGDDLQTAITTIYKQTGSLKKTAAKFSKGETTIRMRLLSYGVKMNPKGGSRV